MRLPTLISSSAFIAAALISMNSSFAQCPGGRCPAPQQYNRNPHWQGNQNPNWQGNQTPYYRNDGGWDNQANYQNQSQGNNYYSRQANDTGFSNSSNMFDEDDSSSYDQDQINYLYHADSIANAEAPSQGYYIKQENSQSANAKDQNAGPDSLVQHKIEEGLKSNYLRKNYENVIVRVYSGNVTLSGSVETEQDRQEVESRVRAIKGVKNINDQIRVAPSENKVSLNENKRRSNIAIAEVDGSKVETSKTTTVADHDLKKQVDDALKSNYVKKNYDTVIVTVTNGVVTVSGLIEEEKDRQEIRDRIQKIDGVSNINDRLQVSALKK